MESTECYLTRLERESFEKEGMYVGASQVGFFTRTNQDDSGVLQT